MARRKPSDDRGPYRAGGGDAPLASGEDGLVGDLVRQFADPYAFHRELVQNAIDAGATQITVRIVVFPSDDGTEARVSVTDDGCGMSQKILEEDLVVLFRSSKEGVEGKIGKFGIGFVSVLALAPRLVEVSSSVGDGARHVLHLHPDRTYDLYREQAPSGSRGTTVTVHVPIEGDGAELVARSRAALSRWCEHARVPIRLIVLEPEKTEPSVDERIDRPLGFGGSASPGGPAGIDALVSVAVRSEDGKTDAAIGLVSGARLAAFYNQGLLLHETRDKGARASIAFKVADGRLSHTLSREDVRRDAAFDRVIALVDRGIEDVLTPAVARELEVVAIAHANGEPDAGARWLAIASAAHSAELTLPPNAMVVPLLGEARGRRVARLSEIHAQAAQPGAFVDALAAAGVCVMDGRIASTDEERRVLAALLSAHRKDAMAHDLHTVVTPLDDYGLSSSDRRLLSHVCELLSHAVRKPSALCFAKVEGRERGLSVVVESTEASRVVSPSVLAGDPFRLIARPSLALAIDHPIASRARAQGDVLLAADVLARAILLERGLLTEQRSLLLTELALGALATGGKQ